MSKKNKRYLSFGAGVNSTALMLLLEEKKIEFESIFVDHGGDLPETYEYVDYLQKEGHPITILKPHTEGCSTIEQYCLKYNIKPLRQVRWCTDKFKLKPIRDFIESPSIVYIGIDAGEKSRAYRRPLKKGVENRYPLVDLKIDRRKCKKIIRKAGLKIPRRSGCWFCPFMKASELRYLRLNHPELYRRRKLIFENADIQHARRRYNLLSNYM